MKEVVIRGLRIGHGRPKICVPLMGKDCQTLKVEAKASLTVPCDLVEWRVDYFNELTDVSSVLETAQVLREVLGDTPLIFTFRSSREGGVKAFTDEDYFRLYQQIIPTGLVDLVDLELLMPTDKLRETVALAKQHQIFVIMCHHNFKETPSKEKMSSYLRMMAANEADICKLAVMPNSPKDVLSLLEMTEEMNRELATRPLITMSMGELGKVSRVTGDLFGSTITFGTIEEASAPGQLPVRDLAMVLELLSLDK